MNDDDKNCIKEAGKNIAAMAIRIKKEKGLSPKEAVDMVFAELQREICSAIAKLFSFDATKKIRNRPTLSRHTPRRSLDNAYFGKNARCGLAITFSIVVRIPS